MASNHDHGNKVEAPGTLVLSLIFLAVFVVLWFLHYKWLGEIWEIR